MRRFEPVRFHHWVPCYFMALAFLYLTQPSAAQITEIRVDMEATIPELPMATEDMDVSTSDDDLAVSIVGSHRGGGLTYNYFAFAEGLSRFGGSTDIRVIDSGPAERRAKVSGEWSAVYRKKADSTGRIPFRISNTKLELGSRSTEGDSAEWFFSFKTTPSTLAATPDEVIDAARLEYDGSNYVTTLEPEVLTGSLDVTGTGGSTLARYDFDIYEGSLDIADIPVDSLFSLNYRWNATINVDATSYGKAQFYDPVMDEGGISFDTTGLELVTVPEPSSAVLGLLAFGMLVAARRACAISR